MKVVNGRIFDIVVDVLFNFFWEIDMKECSFIFYYYIY